MGKPSNYILAKNARLSFGGRLEAPVREVAIEHETLEHHGMLGEIVDQTVMQTHRTVLTSVGDGRVDGFKRLFDQMPMVPAVGVLTVCGEDFGEYEFFPDKEDLANLGSQDGMGMLRFDMRTRNPSSWERKGWIKNMGVRADGGDHPEFRQMRYVGRNRKLQGKLARVFVNLKRRKAYAQFNDVSTGYGYGWWPFSINRFEELK